MSFPSDRSYKIPPYTGALYKPVAATGSTYHDSNKVGYGLLSKMVPRFNGPIYGKGKSLKVIKLSNHQVFRPNKNTPSPMSLIGKGATRKAGPVKKIVNF